MGNCKKYLHLFAEGAPCFFAFLLSIFIYVSVFNLSVSNLINDTKFWFCISNTLIFIVAADCGAFSPPPPNFHGGDFRRNDHNASAKITPNQQDKVIETDSGKPSEEIPHSGSPTEISILPKFVLTKNYERSKSEKLAKKSVVEKERKITMRRSKTMIRHESSMKEEEEEGNEFAKMTDEELNRRVEEFIERFNRQIRLQEISGHGHEVN